MHPLWTITTKRPEYRSIVHSTVTTKKREELSSNPQKFMVNGAEIEVGFSILRTTSHDIGRQPLSFHSIMTFEFQTTSDYVFLQKLW